MFQATNSSFPQGASHLGGQADANNYQQNRRIKVVSTNEESGFDNRRPDRLTIYRAKVFPERPLEPLRLELQRDMKVTNKLFILLHSIDGLYQERELYITLKQATNLLIKVKHDF